MPRYAITLTLTLADGADSEHVAEHFAEELLRESCEHLLDHEQVELASVQRATPGASASA